MTAIKLPRSTSSLKIKAAVKNLKRMSLADRIQLMVKAKLITQDEANSAKRRVARNGHQGK